MSLKNVLWVEKYRPQTIEDCILPESYKQIFAQFVKKKEIPNLLLSGGAGVGKTTIAKAMCREIGADNIVINSSMSGNIDTLRNDIRSFASSISFSGSRKVVILDEADYLTHQTQPALRNFMEEFSNNCAFILTCNYKEKIIEPLKSRCSVIDFKFTKDEKLDLAGKFLKRIFHILNAENIKYEKTAVMKVLKKHMPDWRRVINELQTFASIGEITETVVNVSNDSSLEELVMFLKTKNFTKMRQWVAEKSEGDAVGLFNSLFNKLEKTLEPNSVAELVLILNDAQYKAAFVANQEINMIAALTEVMARCEFN